MIDDTSTDEMISVDVIFPSSTAPLTTTTHTPPCG